MDSRTDSVMLRCQIAALERKLAADEAEETVEETEEVKTEARVARNLNAEIETMLSELEDEDEPVETSRRASEVDPEGIEERITQKRLSEVERITHGVEKTTAPAMSEAKDDGEENPPERAMDNEDDAPPSEAAAPEATPEAIEASIRRLQARIAAIERNAEDDEDEDEAEEAPEAEEPVEARRASLLASATRRLDRVADYLEKNGKKVLAYRIDRVSDAIERKISK